MSAETSAPATPSSTPTPPQTPSESTLLLLDGHSLAFRAFYALRPENFSTTGGQHTNAVYGFLGMFLTLLEKEQPTHVAVAFDLEGPTFREKDLPEYKAQRPSTPVEFRGQIDLIRRAVQTLGVTTLDRESYEADDIIASLATQATAAGMRTLICTGDRDSLQLVSDSVTVLYTLKGVSDLHRFTPKAVLEKYGVTPKQYPDLAALRGDTSDNMPGIPGVGPKTAQKWLDQYSSLTGILEHKDEIKGKVGQALRDHTDQVVLARAVTEMVKDLDLVASFDDLRPRDVEAQDALDLFEQLQFGTRLRSRAFEIRGVAFEDTASPAAALVEVELKPGGLKTWLKKHRHGVSIGLRQGEEAAPAAGDSAEANEATSGMLALDGLDTPAVEPSDRTDTASPTAVGDQISLLGADFESVTLNLPSLGNKDRAALQEWFSDATATKWLHDAKSGYHWLARHGFELSGVEHDTMIAAYLLRPEVRTQTLSEVVQRYLGYELEGSLTHETAAIANLVASLVEELKSKQAEELYYDLEVPLALVLARMEAAGIRVNREVLEERVAEYTEKIADEVAQARALADNPKLNLASPKQLQEVLFETFDLPRTKKTKTGYSTAVRELEKLAESTGHPFLAHLMAHRSYQKMKSIIEGLIDAIADDGRIHTTFNQTAAATGRLSSSEPNLQNIPVRSAEGRMIRSAFEVGQGYETLLTADYSQIEMRVMAHLSADADLIAAYKSGEDLHNFVGSKVFDVPVTEVTPELRRKVKALSYGLVYGLSAYGLSEQLGIPAGEAKLIMENYFTRFGGVKRYLDSVVEAARETGYTQTLFGRRRYLPELASSNRVARDNAERAALNAPIQGTAADIMKLAMLRVDRAIAEAGLSSRVVLQVHDELVVEVAPGELDEMRRILEDEMSRAAVLNLPLEVASGAGENWDIAAH